MDSKTSVQFKSGWNIVEYKHKEKGDVYYRAWVYVYDDGTVTPYDQLDGDPDWEPVLSSS